ncbi:hypothetical protein TRFO_19304 [Tritrichomonas foetus]|uniref:Uncharacterized protein n=1 Tax=Tritrichomonas foetus TaxID=1144522 RepID=A0A1J4KJ06_9EUKA|nr:hypothetical protein TRFO_19304 [Tritrichomonas foetus]|eukprot:OHT11319.1 hypothetical protein TRFO_19304 [Tritrichomonas foetus]
MYDYAQPYSLFLLTKKNALKKAQTAMKPINSKNNNIYSFNDDEYDEIRSNETDSYSFDSRESEDSDDLDFPTSEKKNTIDHIQDITSNDNKNDTNRKSSHNNKIKESESDEDDFSKNREVSNKDIVMLKNQIQQKYNYYDNEATLIIESSLHIINNSMLHTCNSLEQDIEDLQLTSDDIMVKGGEFKKLSEVFEERTGALHKRVKKTDKEMKRLMLKNYSPFQRMLFYLTKFLSVIFTLLHFHMYF